jgi:hypothetical protein
MQVNRPLASEAQVEAVESALKGEDAGLWSRGGVPDRELIGVIIAAISTAQSPSDDERIEAAAKLEKDRAVAACKRVLDEKQEREAEQASRDAKGTDSELDRLRHWATVSTYNAGVRRCIAAILAP